MKAIKNIFFILLIAAIGWLGYAVFIKTDSSELLSVSSDTSTVSIESQQFLQKLQKLKQLDFNSGLFSDARFRGLIDFRQPITDEPYGRENPFVKVR